MEGRAKVAYDPRDFDNTNEEKEQPKLTLMEEILLLGIKDKAVSPAFLGRRVGNGRLAAFTDKALLVCIAPS